MSVKIVHDSYTRILKSGETKTYYRTYTYKTKENTNHVGKQRCRDKVTVCNSEEQMQQILEYMDKIGF